MTNPGQLLELPLLELAVLRGAVLALPLDIVPDWPLEAELPLAVPLSAAESSDEDSFPSLFLSSFTKSFSCGEPFASSRERNPSLFLSMLLNDIAPSLRLAIPLLPLAPPEAVELEGAVVLDPPPLAEGEGVDTPAPAVDGEVEPAEGLAPAPGEVLPPL